VIATTLDHAGLPVACTPDAYQSHALPSPVRAVGSHIVFRPACSLLLMMITTAQDVCYMTSLSRLMSHYCTVIV
jgi:hypothetical protein